MIECAAKNLSPHFHPQNQQNRSLSFVDYAENAGTELTAKFMYCKLLYER